MDALKLIKEKLNSAKAEYENVETGISIASGDLFADAKNSLILETEIELLKHLIEKLETKKK